jgi:hypothetical protein
MTKLNLEKFKSSGVLGTLQKNLVQYTQNTEKKPYKLPRNKYKTGKLCKIYS